MSYHDEWIEEQQSGNNQPVSERDLMDYVREQAEFRQLLEQVKPGWYVVWHDAAGHAHMTDEPFGCQSYADIFAVALGRDAFIVECK